MPIPGHFRLSARASTMRAGPQNAESSKRPHVLVVDDVRAIVEVVCEVLLGDGFTVESTTDATEALAWLTQRPQAFDAIVSDLDMPHMTGTVLLQRARQAGFSGKTVIHSGSLTEADDAELDRVADAVVEKPFATRVLAPTLRKLLTGLGP